ncbi:MAG: putative multiple ankyrin repeat single kh domain protein [Flavipsychrobacter sp.]|jgi:ankyrin repeat protein|nr:putative multiple ankyrin repeat single kh domain protein [Flavipsychrobacter sp.]
MIKKTGLVLVVLVNTVVCFSQTLSEAISKRDTVAAVKLIKSGADVNAVDNYGTSALMNACRWADDTAVSFLLRHGATVDKPKSPKGRTPLMVACAYYSGKSICNMLIDRGADVNVAAQDCSTPLMVAAQSAKLDVVELLLKKGANPNAKDASGKTALEYAKNATELEYIKKSVKDCRIDKDETIRLLARSMK